MAWGGHARFAHLRILSRLTPVSSPRKRGPITTGRSCGASKQLQRSTRQLPVVMGPGSQLRQEASPRRASPGRRGERSDSNFKQLSAVIVREGGRSSIPETAVLEQRGRRVLDAPPARGMTMEFVRDTSPRSRGMRCPSFASLFTLLEIRGRRESRVLVAPVGPVQQKHGGRTTGSTEAFRLSLRDGVTTYFVLSPVTGLFCHRHP